jgi:hypothetical protein
MAIDIPDRLRDRGIRPPAWCKRYLAAGTPRVACTLLRRVLRTDRRGRRQAGGRLPRSRPRTCSPSPCSASGSRDTTRWRSSTIRARELNDLLSPDPAWASALQDPGAAAHIAQGRPGLETVGRDLRHRAPPGAQQDRPRRGRQAPGAQASATCSPSTTAASRRSSAGPAPTTEWWHDLREQLVHDPGLVQELQSVRDAGQARATCPCSASST